MARLTAQELGLPVESPPATVRFDEADAPETAELSERIPIVVGWRFVRVAIRFGVVGPIGRAGHLLPRPAQEGRDPLSRDAEALGDLVHCQAFGVERARLGAAHAGSTDVERF
jgi:hypothetical protein